MKSIVLSSVVLIQIAVFQFAYVLGHRSFARGEARAEGGPPADSLLRYAAGASRTRMLFGGALGVAALLSGFEILGAPGARKLMLAAVSLLSSLGFALAIRRDGVQMRLFADALPDGGVRRASLAPRTLGRWYPPFLEIVPVAVFLATALTVILAAGATEPGTGYAVSEKALTHASVLLAAQGLFVAGALLFVLWRGTGPAPMTARIPSLRTQPEAALELGEKLAGTQALYFLMARIGVALMLGTSAAHAVFEAGGYPAAGFFDAAGWVLIAVLLLLYIGYLRRVAGLSRRIQERMEAASQ